MPGLRVPFALDSVPRARHELRTELGEVGVPREVVDDALLVLSELLGNALRHAHPLPDGTLRVEWAVEWTTATSVLSLAVTDGGGSTAPHPRAVAPAATSGRGLSIVDAVTDDWGVHRAADATTVWASLPVRVPVGLPVG